MRWRTSNEKLYKKSRLLTRFFVFIHQSLYFTGDRMAITETGMLYVPDCPLFLSGILRHFVGFVPININAHQYNCDGCVRGDQ